MVDVVDPQTRSRMMSGIRAKHTVGEMSVRRALHQRGYRYRLHQRLPGTPDIVFPRYQAVVFVHGCFWHGHECSLFKWPATRTEFWRAKISANVARDARANEALVALGWRIAEVWECSLKGSNRIGLEAVIDLCDHWLKSTDARLEVRGLE